MNEIKRKILLAEDDGSFGELLKNYLEMNNFETHWFMDGIKAYKGFIKNPFDICLLDIMMPEMNGFQLADEIKRLNPDIPVLFLTAKALKEDMLTAYKCGADDYIIKPFDSELLIFKINAIIKRSGSINVALNTTKFSFGEYTFDSNLQQLKGPKALRQLSTRESDLLKLLCLYKNNLLPRDIALKKIWGSDDYFNGRSMDVYITKIRKYIKEDSSIEIINVHGKGYRLNTDVIKAQ